ncbi:peptidase M42 [Saccharophagus degradans]|uniref:Peptidase M42 n=1 Tax=Saccharophagus degradans TaxID=86304 RepID=A0AAW7X788_9GAMM|nr:peptidase M42 [Saccharophagus degradans]MBU2984634.1 peptidase M42 [Saccharophagus degradans]MDO6422337.1 peptidase M42 [Saccharophagus degradans]MDO6608123.1 peptidase M42 [Saccharophagus degradans]
MAHIKDALSALVADSKTGLPATFINLLSILVRSPSVVGAEHSFFRVLQRELEERGAKVTWYEGLLVAQGSEPDSLMLSAHSDRHGLVCTGPNEFQYAAFVAGARSDLLGNSVDEQLMRKVVDRFPNEQVYAYEPWSGAYRGKGKIKNAYICEYRNNLIFELEGMEHLVAGTPVAFKDNLKVTEQALIGQMDNVLTVAVLVYMFEIGFQGTAFFTAQEEAGKSWRYLLEWFRRFGGSTNQLVVVDTSPYPDFATAQKQELVLRNKDANAKFNNALTQKLAKLCAANDISVQFKDEYVEAKNAELASRNEPPASLGSTEMGRIISASKGLVDGTTLQIPTSGYHTLSESAPLESVSAFIYMLALLADQNIDEILLKESSNV